MLALRIAFLVLFFAFSLMSFVGNNFGLATVSNLIGFTPETPVVPLSWRTYLNGTFQSSYETRFDIELGFREQFVRADNEFNLRAFHQIGLNPRTSMVIGKNDFLFERDYLDAFNRHDEVPRSQLEAKVRRILLLQQYLESRGSTLLVVITPSKPLLYPEYLPERYIFKERQSVPTNYDKFAPLLAQYGVHFVDGQAFLQERKATVPFTFFGNTGTHWNDVAACEVSSVVIETIGQQLNRQLPSLRCKPYASSIRQRKRDIDILQLCNLWSEERLYQPVFRPRAKLVPHGPAEMPTLLMVGGSFVFYIDDYINMYRMKHVIWRYYAREYNRGVRPLVREAIDWEQSVFSQQVVLLEVNAQFVHDVGWGFLEDAERAIQKAKAQAPAAP
jgi:hypothetical protein